MQPGRARSDVTRETPSKGFSSVDRTASRQPPRRSWMTRESKGQGKQRVCQERAPHTVLTTQPPASRPEGKREDGLPDALLGW
eukprot:359329-Chlamydomonas_euryale.AAC.2